MSMKIFKNKDEICIEANRQLERLTRRISREALKKIEEIDNQEIEDRLWGKIAVESLVCEAACDVAKEAL